MGTFVDFSLLSRFADSPQTFSAGQTIFRAGERGTEFYVVKSGRVAVRLGNRTLDTLGEGDIFGEMALIDDAPRSADVVAETDCIVVPVGEKQFLFMTGQAPYFALSVMRVLVERLRRANQALPGN